MKENQKVIYHDMHIFGYYYGKLEEKKANMFTKNRNILHAQIG